MRFRSPRSRPTPESETAQEPATVPGPADPIDPAVRASRPSPTGRRPRPLPSPRPEVDAGSAPADVDTVDEDEDDEYWDDEYDDEYDDDYDDEYDDYDDDLEDEYDGEPGEDDPGEDDTVAEADRRRRLLGRRRKERARRRRLGRRRPVEVDDALTDEPAEQLDEQPARPRPRPAPVPLGAEEDAAGLALPGVEPGTDDGPHDGLDDGAGAPVPAPRRRLPRVPVAAMRAGTARGWAGTRSGVGRGWAATRTGSIAAWHFLRTHWARAAYIYLGIVAVAMLFTTLLYWNSGFTYDECNYCGIPVLLTVSPWWLLILPFNVAQWPLVLPLLVILLFAGLNAELVDRWSKRPQPEYPDWE